MNIELTSEEIISICDSIIEDYRDLSKFPHGLCSLFRTKIHNVLLLKEYPDKTKHLYYIPSEFTEYDRLLSIKMNELEVHHFIKEFTYENACAHANAIQFISEPRLEHWWRYQQYYKIDRKSRIKFVKWIKSNYTTNSKTIKK